MLKKLREVASSFAGETMLVNPAGQYLQSPDPTHEWGWLLGHSYSFGQEYPEAWLNVRNHSSTQIQIKGQFVLVSDAVPRDSLGG